MAEDNRDVLMKILLNGSPIPAESQASIDPKDAMTTGFVAASAGGPANFFSLKQFNLDMGLIGEPSDKDDPNSAKKQQEANQAAFKALAELAKNPGGKAPGTADRSGQFERFMMNGAAGLRGKAYKSNLDSVSITKNMDASSLTLLQACLKSTTLDSAILVKRRGGGLTQLRSYLKIEFTNLLITDFDWSEDDVVKETWKFVCREAKVQYAVENYDGTLQPAGVPRSWSMLKQNS